MAALEIPALIGFKSKVFDIGHYQQVNPTGDVGFTQTLQRTSPAWFAEYETPPLRGDRANAAQGFFDQLEGSMNRFLAYDPRRIKPYAYLSEAYASTPWGATPRITAQSYANSTISLDQMTAGAIVTTGDYISVYIAPTWYLFRATETRTATGGGVIAALYVKPRPNIVPFSTTAIRYHKPCIEMKVLGRVEWQDTVDSLPVARFKAGQYTNRVPS